MLAFHRLRDTPPQQHILLLLLLLIVTLAAFATSSILQEARSQAAAAADVTQHGLKRITPAAAAHRPPAAPPITRRIVPDLTHELQTELAAHNISVLLVVSNPSDSSSASSIDLMKIDWNSLTISRNISFISSYKEFQRKWRTYLLLDDRIAHHTSRRADPADQQPNSNTGSNTDLGQQHQSSMPDPKPQQAQASAARLHRHELMKDAQLLSTGQSQHHHHKQVHPTAAFRVAVLSHVVNGSVGLKQLHLAEAVSRKVDASHKLSLDYSSWSEKGDSLIAFTPNGQAQSAAFLSTNVYRDAFSNIYEKRLWKADGGGSGWGSSWKTTKNIRRQLPALIAKYNISSMLDSSCGSMHWMPKVVQTVTEARPDFKYMGTDVVCGLIEKHKAKYSSRKNMQFQCIDYSNQNLPSGYDLVFSRDSLQHVPHHATWMFLNNVKASGARYLLVGSYMDVIDANPRDIVGGDYYEIDLTRPPFNVWPPVEVIDEQTPDGKHMVLFDMRSVTWTDDLQGLV